MANTFMQLTIDLRKSLKLVHQLECGTNTKYLIDFIQICLSPKLLNPAEIHRLYVEDRLTCPQIARRFGVSRITILSHLHDMGIKNQEGSRTTNPKNYRQRVPPYGYSIRDGELVPNRTELKICRLVVELVQRERRAQTEVARDLSRRGYNNRARKSDWNSKTVFNIYKRWKDKL